MPRLWAGHRPRHLLRWLMCLGPRPPASPSGRVCQTIQGVSLPEAPSPLTLLQSCAFAAGEPVAPQPPRSRSSRPRPRRPPPRPPAIGAPAAPAGPLGPSPAALRPDELGDPLTASPSPGAARTEPAPLHRVLCTSPPPPPPLSCLATLALPQNAKRPDMLRTADV